MVLLYQKQLCYNRHKEKTSGYQGMKTSLYMTKSYKKEKTVKIVKKICFYGKLCYNKKECTHEHYASPMMRTQKQDGIIRAVRRESGTDSVTKENA